nr:hypothetical protein [uncultured Desulfobacter sp.]
MNIEDARDELNCILSDLQKDSEYSEIEFKIALEHAYHHLNHAWNIRDIDEDRIGDCSEEDDKTWSKYPKDNILPYD